MMSSATLYRASGLALLLSAPLGILGNTLDSVLSYNSDPHQYLTALWTIVVLINLASVLLLLLGLPAILTWQAPRIGWLGLLGFILTFAGNFLYIGYYAISLIDLPWLAQVAPTLAANYGPSTYTLFLQVTAIAYALGGVLLGVAILRAAIMPRLTGPLLLIGAVINLGTILPVSSVMSAVFNVVGFVLYCVALGWMGYVLMAAKGAEKVHSTTSSFAIGD